jgi:hypothetical protein
MLQELEVGQGPTAENETWVAWELKLFEGHVLSDGLCSSACDDII